MRLEYYLEMGKDATFRSRGEVILVKLTSIDDLHTQINVLGKPINKTTLIDFGKSSMNIEKLRSAFHQKNLQVFSFFLIFY